MSKGSDYDWFFFLYYFYYSSFLGAVAHNIYIFLKNIFFTCFCYFSMQCETLDSSLIDAQMHHFTKAVNKYSFKRLNSIRMWYKTYVLSFQSQHATSSYQIFKNKHNYTQSIIIPIYKSNQIENLLRYY